jgi:hypothetical protein
MAFLVTISISVPWKVWHKQALIFPTDGVSTLAWWWGLSASRDPESYAGGSVTTGSATHAGQVKE